MSKGSVDRRSGVLADKAPEGISSVLNAQKSSALFLSAFFDELIHCGITDVVVSPGSRSTPLSMVAYASDLHVHIDVDERGAAFFALGLAKASGRPVCVICTSGTAVANYYPAVLEAEASRVPLLVLTGDRPPRLQNLGAPQTCDQIDAFGCHVRHFQQMPLPGAKSSDIALARQMALVAFSKAVGNEASESDTGETWYGCISDAGPIHFNFPFDEPLKPDLQTEELFTVGRRSLLRGEMSREDSGSLPANHQEKVQSSLRPFAPATAYPDEQTMTVIRELVQKNRSIVLCGEGSCVNDSEARNLIAWAQKHQLPLLADPLSNLRSFDDPLIIDNYDSFFEEKLCSQIDLVIRFGRYPISKACFSALASCRPIQIVVDAFETRDFNALTDLFLRCTPAAFVASAMFDETFSETEKNASGASEVGEAQRTFAQIWMDLNDAEATHIKEASQSIQDFEGPFVQRLFDLAPESSAVFSASSMSIRMVDTFYLKQNKKLTVLCNRGLNGIDGCTSSALGTAFAFKQTTFLTGDLAFLHDLNALALQRELLLHPFAENPPSVIIVVMNNGGGGIFEILPQASEENYFERLFLTPQKVDFSAIVSGFDIPYAKATTVEDFEKTYRHFLGDAGIHVIEVVVSSSHLKENYGKFGK